MAYPILGIWTGKYFSSTSIFFILDMCCIHKSFSNVIQIFDCSSWCFSYSIFCLYNAWCYAFWRSHFQLAKSYSRLLHTFSIYLRWFQAGIHDLPRCSVALHTETGIRAPQRLDLTGWSTWCSITKHSIFVDPKLSYADMEIGNKEYCHLFFLRYHMFPRNSH